MRIVTLPARVRNTLQSESSRFSLLVEDDQFYEQERKIRREEEEELEHLLDSMKIDD